MTGREAIAITAAAAAGLGATYGIHRISEMNLSPEQQNAVLIACAWQIDGKGRWGTSTSTLPEVCQSIGGDFDYKTAASGSVSGKQQIVYEIPRSGTDFVIDNWQSQGREYLVEGSQDLGALAVGGAMVWVVYGKVREGVEGRERQLASVVPLVSGA